MSTLRVSNIEAKADPSSPSVNEKVKITNSNEEVLLQIDGASSGITTVGINTTGNTFTVDNQNSNVSFSSTISSPSIGIGTMAPRTALDLSQKTDAILLPQGTTAQRPTGDNPYIRYNTTNSALEFYNGTDWVEIISDYFPSGSTILG
jgi:hypothetical protein